MGCKTTSFGGVDREAIESYICEQIYTLPGTASPEGDFTILVTGSRATGTHAPGSDVDVDVVCPQAVYDAVHKASFEAGIVQARRSFFVPLDGDDWARYFGPDIGRPHFSFTPLERVARHFDDYEDVWLWVWTNAKVFRDPRGQFGRIAERFSGYPRDILVRKIKYRWLMAGFWTVEVYPYNHACSPDMLLAASTAVLNSVNELLRLFFLMEGRPFPYHSKLMRLATETEMGQEFLPLLQRLVERVSAIKDAETPVWERLEKSIAFLNTVEDSDKCRRFEAACFSKMIEAGVEPEWVEADFRNIDELLHGELGPIP
jgi:Domain of unknown function (DUF4037)/Nucleotidyltransferase domain